MQVNNNIVNIDLNLEYDIDDPQFYILPELIPSNFSGGNDLNYKLDELDENQRAAAITIIDKLSPYLKVWDVKYNVYQYHFQLPPTCFNQRVKQFGLPHQIQQAYEYNQIQQMSDIQIQQIKDTGTFEVPSQQFPIPYVWQISSWIIKGRKNITKSFQYNLAYLYELFKTWPNILYRDNDNDGRNFTIRCGLYNLLILPTLYLSILFGFKETFTEVNDNLIKRQIEKQRQIELKQINTVNFEVYKIFKKEKKNEINHKNEEMQSEITIFASEFESQVNSIKVQIQNSYDLKNEKQEQLLTFEDEEREEYEKNLQQQIDDIKVDYIKKFNIQINQAIDINNQLDEQLYQVQQQYWQNSQLSKSISSQIISLGNCLRLYQYHEDIYKQQLNKQLEIFKEQLIEKNEIRSKCDIFMDEQIKKEKKLLKKQFKEQFLQNLLNDLNQLHLEETRIFEHYLTCNKRMKQQLINIKKEREEFNKNPQIIKHVERHAFPPYEVYQCQDTYFLRKIINYTIYSNKPFWKIQLIGLRYYSWTLTAAFWLFANAIQGPVGIKALFLCSSYYPDVEINQTTGQIYKTNKIDPIVVKFSKVLESMKQSRQNFEAQPDIGLFGKSCSRICNLIEVYIFRFLIVGIIITLIIVPIIIIFNFFISFMLAITSWMWIIIVILFNYLFNIIIYDIDVDRVRKNYSQWYSPQCVPLLSNTFNLLWFGILNLFLNLIRFFVLRPFLIIFLFIYAILSYILRNIYDFILLQFVKCIGRVPATENNIAWRISGPGISRKFYYSISLPQLFVLIQANLEQSQLSYYKQKITKLISNPQEQINEKIGKIFKVLKFNNSFSFQDPTVHQLQNQLNKQINERKQFYPQIDGEIKFTKEELIYILNQTKIFLKSQIKLKKLQQMIWESYKVEKGNYNKLAEIILTQIFGQTILEPFEDIEMRFQMNIQQNFKFIYNVEKVMDGSIFFKIPNEYSIKQKQKNIPQILKKFIPYSTILQEIQNCQDLTQEWSSIDEKTKRFFVNYSLQEN